MTGLARAAEVLTTIAAVSTGLLAGTYAAFSTMIMPALRSGPTAEALTTMQRINVFALHPGFMVIFWSSGIASAASVVVMLLTGGSRSGWTVAASALALVGLVITAAINVPRNTALAGLDPTSAPDLRTAADLLSGWVTANHARAIVSVLALTAFLR